MTLIAERYGIAPYPAGSVMIPSVWYLVPLLSGNCRQEFQQLGLVWILVLHVSPLRPHERVIVLKCILLASDNVYQLVPETVEAPRRYEARVILMHFYLLLSGLTIHFDADVETIFF